jgi:septum formation protein
MSRPPIVLASTSPWRRGLLERLGLPFSVIDPQLDETPWHEAGLTPEALVMALASAKARAAAEAAEDGAVILAADQVAEVDGLILTKPGTPSRAVDQLGTLSGRTHRLLTGLVLLNTANGEELTHLDEEQLQMRELTLLERQNYVAREDVLSCAGSYRIEGLGIALFETISLPDFTGVIGLPLLAVVRLLERVGISPLD